MKVFWPSCFQIPDRRPPWQWAAEKLRLKNSPFGSRFLPDLTPWLKEPSEEAVSNKWEELTAMCCVQGAKTVLIQIIAAHAIRFAPAPMMINCQTNDDARDFARERFNPMIESDPDIAAKLPADRSKKSQCTISMTDMFVMIQGANLTNLQSKSIRWLFNDEVFLWKNGLLDHARKRTTQYWNRKRINCSTAGDKGGDLDLAFEAGDKREWHLQCPECGRLNLPKWERIKWPKDGVVQVTDGSGGFKEQPVKLEAGWNYAAVKAATVFECADCGARHKHTETVHRQMNAGAKYIPTNPNPTPGWISFRWNALCLSPSVCSWGDLAVEWLKAEAEFEKGNEAPRKEFITKRLAESYDTSDYFKCDILPTEKLDLSWPDEAYRFMTVDVQEKEFWVIIRAWSKTGESRLLWAGRLHTWHDLDAKQAEFKVLPQCVFVDCGNDTNKVIRECALRNKLVKVGGRYDWVGWKALDGHNRETKSFTYKPKNAKPMLLPYSWPPKYHNGTSGAGGSGGSFCKVHLWSNRTIKDITVRLRDGKGARWVAYDGVCREWQEHMFSERRIIDYDANGFEVVKWVQIGRRENHLWDGENMNTVAACMASVIGDPIPDGKEETAEIPAVIDSR